MLQILYEDESVIVVEKPVGLESQSNRKFSPDMVSEIKKHIHKQYPNVHEPYLGVIHRLDKPVGGIMVYGKRKDASASLSSQLQQHQIVKKYLAVVCGKPVDNRGVYVDYLLKDGEKNVTQIVDKCITGGKIGELSYNLVDAIEDKGKILSLLEISLKTGRHHQIRVQMAHHGTPLWGDQKYNPDFVDCKSESVALFAYNLEFRHPVTRKKMKFNRYPKQSIFTKFDNEKGAL